jgi:hypothetical protein
MGNFGTLFVKGAGIAVRVSIFMSNTEAALAPSTRMTGTIGAISPTLSVKTLVNQTSGHAQFSLDLNVGTGYLCPQISEFFGSYEPAIV